MSIKKRILASVTRVVGSLTRGFARWAYLPGIIAMAVVGSSCGGNTTAVPSAVPDSLTVLRRMVAAHRSLGPATIRGLYITKSHNKAFKDSTDPYRVLRNDAHHYVFHGSIGTDFTEYVDGDVSVAYFPHDRTYTVVRKRDPKEAAYDSAWIPNQTAVWLHDSTLRRALAVAKVTAATQGKEPIWKLEWDAPAAGARPQLRGLLSLSVGRSDSLVREVTFMGMFQGLVETRTATYAIRSKPFPAKTFRFVVPPGAKRYVPTGEH